MTRSAEWVASAVRTLPSPTARRLLRDDLGASAARGLGLGGDETAGADVTGVRFEGSGEAGGQGEVGKAGFQGIGVEVVEVERQALSALGDVVHVVRAARDQRARGGEEGDAALRLDLGVASDGGVRDPREKGAAVVDAGDAALVVVAAEDAVMCVEAGRFVGTDEGHVVARASKVPCGGGADQAASDDGDLHGADGRVAASTARVSSSVRRPLAASLRGWVSPRQTAAKCSSWRIEWHAVGGGGVVRRGGLRPVLGAGPDAKRRELDGAFGARDAERILTRGGDVRVLARAMLEPPGRGRGVGEGDGGGEARGEGEDRPAGFDARRLTDGVRAEASHGGDLAEEMPQEVDLVAEVEADRRAVGTLAPCHLEIGIGFADGPDQAGEDGSADGAGGQDVLEGRDARVEAAVVAGEDVDPGVSRGRDHAVDGVEVGGEGLFDEGVEAAGGGFEEDGLVELRGRGDDDAVRLGIAVGQRGEAGGVEGGSQRGVGVDHACERQVGMLGDVGGMAAADQARTGDEKARHRERPPAKVSHAKFAASGVTSIPVTSRPRSARARTRSRRGPALRTWIALRSQPAGKARIFRGPSLRG